ESETAPDVFPPISVILSEDWSTAGNSHLEKIAYQPAIHPLQSYGLHVHTIPKDIYARHSVWFLKQKIMFLPENTMNGYQLKSNQSVHYGFQTALLPELFLYFQSSLTLF